nr:MAG TPA: hypothetical protein [Caudoviricetes sp.]
MSPTEVTLLRSAVPRNSGAHCLFLPLPTTVLVGFGPDLYYTYRLSVFKNC